MDDLIERLRQEARDNYDEISAPKCLWWEAADAIAELELAKEILVPRLLDRIVELEGEREAIAKMVEESEVFCEHGCTDRIAALIRGESDEQT